MYSVNDFVWSYIDAQSIILSYFTLQAIKYLLYFSFLVAFSSKLLTKCMHIIMWKTFTQPQVFIITWYFRSKFLFSSCSLNYLNALELMEFRVNFLVLLCKTAACHLRIELHRMFRKKISLSFVSLFSVQLWTSFSNSLQNHYTNGKIPVDINYIIVWLWVHKRHFLVFAVSL